MSNTYILLKDLPNVPAGTEITWNDTSTWSGGPYRGGRYGVWDMPSEKSCTQIWTCEDVENNPEWFKLKEQVEEKRIEVKTFAPFTVNDGGIYGLTLKGNNKILPEKYEAVKRAIERELNVEVSVFDCHPVEKNNKDEFPQYITTHTPEPQDRKDFKWTEDKVKEYGKFCVLKKSWLQWEDFKQSYTPKEEPKPLFVTDDNVKLFKEEDLYWRVYDDLSYGQFRVKDKARYIIEATFISEELASAYVQLRKNKVNIRIS